MNTLIIVALSLFMPFLGFCLSNYLFQYKNINYKACIFSISLFMASLSYSYIPLTETDLTRYFQIIENTKYAGFLDTINFNTYNHFIPYTFNFLFWICNVIENSHFLPFFSTFLVYYISLYLTFSYTDNNVSYKKLVAYYIVIMLCYNWQALANNIRNITAFLIIGCAVFRELELKKKNIWTYILYVIAVFLHPTAIVLIILRIGLVIRNKIKFALVGLIIFAQYFVAYAYNVLYNYISFAPLKQAIFLANKYFSDTNSSWGLVVQNSIVQRAIRLLSFILAGLFILLYFRNNKIKTKFCDSYMQQFGFYLALLTLACAPILTPAYWRFSYCSIAVNSCTFVDNFNSEKRDSVDNTAIHAVFIIAIGLFALNTWSIRRDIIQILKSFAFLYNIPFFEIIKGIFTAIKNI